MRGAYGRIVEGEGGDGGVLRMFFSFFFASVLTGGLFKVRAMMGLYSGFFFGAYGWIGEG